jgi:hypothetical protein
MEIKLEEEKEILVEIKDWYKDLAINWFVEDVTFLWQKNHNKLAGIAHP